MEKSESIKNIGKALILFHLKVENVKKDARNPFFKSAYASLSNIQDVIADPLQESGLSYTQFPTGENGLTTLLIHGESGEYMLDTYEMKPVKDDPQGRGSVITYQRRYALACVLGLNIEDDDDGNTGTHGGKNPEQAAEKANEKPWLNKGTPQYNAVVKRLYEKSATIEQINEHYKLSKEMKQSFLNILNGAEYAS